MPSRRMARHRRQKTMPRNIRRSTIPNSNFNRPASTNKDARMKQTLERALTERAWRDPDFARLLESDPKSALKAIGVEVSDNAKINVRMQRRDTLYFVIPPLADRPEDADKVINQMDLWQSGDLFCWITPQALKLELLKMRQSYRGADHE